VTRLFEGIRGASWLVLALTAVAYTGAILFVNGVLFQPGQAGAALHWVYDATGGLVNGTLVGGLCVLGVSAFIIVGLGRLRASDIGWRMHDVGSGLLLALAVWVVMQGVQAVFLLCRDEFALHEAWKQCGPAGLLGGVLGQLLGNALVEETVFRGFFLPQFYVKATRVFPRGAALAIALLGSQVLFAVSHLPNRFFLMGPTGLDILWEQLGLMAVGLIFAAVYLLTRNLFFVVGFHVLLNAPVPIFQSLHQNTLYAMTFGLFLLVSIGWWRVNRNSQVDEGCTVENESA
jgi:hypothetical protein